MARVDVDGVGIEYEVTGEGPPVVLLHGFPDSGRLWRHQVPALAGAGFQVIVPDLRGYGRSDKPEAVEAYSLMHIAGDVLAILADLNVPQGSRGRPRLGRRAGLGARHLPARHGGPPGRALGRPPGYVPPHAAAAREVVVHAAVPVPRRRRALADRGRLVQLPRLGRAPRRRPGGCRPGGDRLADTRPQVVPGQRAARVVGRAAAPAPAGAGPHHGRLEYAETPPSPRRR